MSPWTWHAGFHAIVYSSAHCARGRSWLPWGEPNAGCTQIQTACTVNALAGQPNAPFVTRTKGACSLPRYHLVWHAVHATHRARSDAITGVPGLACCSGRGAPYHQPADSQATFGSSVWGRLSAGDLPSLSGRGLPTPPVHSRWRIRFPRLRVAHYTPISHACQAGLTEASR
jgi:hypothetical protein